MRKIAIGACFATIAALAGALPAAAAEPGVLAQTFSCADVSNRVGDGSISQWGKECNNNDIFPVGAGKLLCLAVTGSDGHGIRYKVYSGAGWHSPETRELVVGSAPACLYRNRTSRTVTVNVKARSNLPHPLGVDVFGSGEIRN